MRVKTNFSIADLKRYIIRSSMRICLEEISRLPENLRGTPHGFTEAGLRFWAVSLRLGRARTLSGSSR